MLGVPELTVVEVVVVAVGFVLTRAASRRVSLFGGILLVASVLPAVWLLNLGLRFGDAPHLFLIPLGGLILGVRKLVQMEVQRQLAANNNGPS